MTPKLQYGLLVGFGAIVIVFALYLLIEVNAGPRHGASASAGPAAGETHARHDSAPERESEPAASGGGDGAHAITVKTKTGVTPIAPAPPAQDGNLHSAAAGGSGGSAGDDPRHVDARLDALMSEANKSYDGGNYDEAKSSADKVLADQPHNVRMLRIEVSVACLDGDAPTAQHSYDLLPKADRDQMKIRCARSGVTFSDSTPPP